MRIATFNVELSRDGPGLLLRDIRKGDDPQVNAVAEVVAQVAPDILVLQGIDYDHDLLALTALREVLSDKGIAYPFLFARPPNFGIATGLDRDGDGRLGEPEDAQAYGWFAGQGGMAILSQFEIDAAGARDFSGMLWRDIPDALWPWPGADAEKAADIQRLSSGGHWVVPVTVADNVLHLLAFHATPPVFDGPEDRNGRRNHDEITFWRHFMDGAFGPAIEDRFVLIGDANLDPVDADGRKEAIRAILDDKRLFDPVPRRMDIVSVTADQAGDPMLDTVAWPTPTPGHLRVSYILPSVDLRVTGSGVYWPGESTEAFKAVAAASRHRMVWVDLVVE